MKKLVVFIVALSTFCIAAKTSYCNQYWAKIYGDTGGANSIQQTADGGFIILGVNMLLKTDNDGNVEWGKDLGGNCVQETSDGGYIVFGDILLKLDIYGNVELGKNIGGKCVQQTSDGGYVVISQYVDDLWILKLNSDGNVGSIYPNTWQKTYSGGFSAESIRQSFNEEGNPDGYIVAGSTSSFGVGWEDALVMRLDENGDVIWQKTYGGDYFNGASSIQQTLGGGYVFTGRFGGSQEAGDGIWIVKLDSNGDISWGKLAEIHMVSNLQMAGLSKRLPMVVIL